MPKRIATIVLALLLAGRAAQASPSVRDGDIVFQTSRSSQSAAIQKATRSPYSHMGLVLFREGQPYVLEAIGPVQYTPFDKWAARGVDGKVAVKRLRDAAEVLTPEAIEKLRVAGTALQGRPYDFAFAWSDESIYCSELVWKIYKRALGIEIGRLQPLRTFDLTDPLVREKLRERYGDKLPLDEPVISPAAMFADHSLETVAAPDTLSSFLSRVDHLIYATPDLDRTVAEMERLLGVRAAPGGQQPGRGTRNALISLGPHSYLEIVGPDPKQPRPSQPPWWLQGLRKPRIVAWAAKGTDLESLRAKAVDNGVPLGEVISGNRQRPDGVVLTWRFTSPRNPVADGVVPFFIDWGESAHPSSTSPHGVQLVALRAVHPDDRHVQDLLRRLNIELPVTHDALPGIIASLEGPRGRIELR